MSSCPFCACDERILKSNDSAFVLLSNPLKTENHLLVIPKRHVEFPWALTEIELLDIFSLVHELQPKLVQKYGGCDLRQNCRPFMKEGRLSVRHVHFHLIPRSFEDTLYRHVEQFETSIFRDATEVDTGAAEEILRS